MTLACHICGGMEVPMLAAIVAAGTVVTCFLRGLWPRKRDEENGDETC